MSNRDALRSKLLTSHKPKSKLVKVFGAEIELRQPRLGVVMKTREMEDPAERVASMIIQYAYVPGTDELVFEEGDQATITQWPFGQDLIELQQAITSLTGLDLDNAEKELRQDPLDGDSSGSASSSGSSSTSSTISA